MRGKSLHHTAFPTRKAGFYPAISGPYATRLGGACQAVQAAMWAHLVSQNGRGRPLPISARAWGIFRVMTTLGAQACQVGTSVVVFPFSVPHCMSTLPPCCSSSLLCPCSWRVCMQPPSAAANWPAGSSPHGRWRISTAWSRLGTATRTRTGSTTLARTMAQRRRLAPSSRRASAPQAAAALGCVM